MKKHTAIIFSLLLGLLLCAPGALAAEAPAEDAANAAPAGLTIDFVNATIKGVSNKMEYAVSDGAWTAIQANPLEITDKMFGQSVQVRYINATGVFKVDIPKRIGASEVEEQTKQFHFDYATNSLHVTLSDTFQVTTDLKKEKWANVKSTSVKLDALVNAGGEAVKVRYRGDGKAFRFPSEEFEYQFYNIDGRLDKPTTKDIKFDLETECFVPAVEGKTLDGFEYRIGDTAKWSKMSGTSLKAGNKYEKQPVTFFFRRGFDPNNANKAPSEALEFTFATRPAAPGDSQVRMNFESETFYLAESGYEYQLAGSKEWKEVIANEQISMGAAKNVILRKKAVITNEIAVIPASKPFKYTLPKRQSAPKISYNKSTGMLTGLTVNMVYYATTEKVTEKNWDFKVEEGVQVTPAMLDADGSLKISDWENGPLWKGQQLYGKYLYVKQLYDAEKNLRTSLPSKVLLVPLSQDAVDASTVHFDRATESITGVDSSMEFKLESGEKWKSGAKNGTLHVGEFLNESSSDDTQLLIRRKAQGTGDTAQLPSDSISIVIGQRPEAPAVGFDNFAETITGIENTSYYEMSTNGRKWVEITPDLIAKQVPNYSSSGNGKTFYVRRVASSSSVASRATRIDVACRWQTPDYQYKLSDDGVDLLLDLKGRQDDMLMKWEHENQWRPAEVIDFSKNVPIPITDEPVTLSLRIAATEERPASQIKTVKLVRAKAPSVSVNYKSETFPGAKKNMEYRIATAEGDSVTSFGPWRPVSQGSGKSSLSINYATMGGRNMEFRVRATDKKPASMASEVVYVFAQDEYAPEVMVKYDYQKEIMYAQCDWEGVLEYKLRMNNASSEKWAAFPRGGIALAKILDENDETIMRNDNNRAMMMFRVAAETDYPASKNSAVLQIAARPGPPDDISYNYKLEVVEGELNARLEYSISGKPWKALQKTDLVNGVMPVPATKNEQTIQFRYRKTKSSFTSQPLIITIPPAASAPAFSLSELVNFTELEDGLALTVPEGYEFRFSTKGTWLSGKDEPYPLERVYTGEKDVNLYIRRQGSNSDMVVVGQELRLVLPARPKVPSDIKYMTASGRLMGVRGGVEFLLCESGYKVTGREEIVDFSDQDDELWVKVSGSHISNKYVLLTADDSDEVREIYVRIGPTSVSPASAFVKVGKTTVVRS